MPSGHVIFLIGSLLAKWLNLLFLIFYWLLCDAIILKISTFDPFCQKKKKKKFNCIISHIHKKYHLYFFNLIFQMWDENIITCKLSCDLLNC